MKLKKLLANNKGFTLIELMVVVIIIGILAAIAIPQFAKQSDSARESAVQADLKTLKNATEMYYAEYAAYPPESSGTTDLSEYGVVVSEMSNPWDDTADYTYVDNTSSYYWVTSGKSDDSTGNWKVSNTREPYFE